MRKNLNKHSKSGFVSLNLVLFLTLFMTLYFTISVGSALAVKKDSVRTSCYESALDLESYLLSSARKLFALNKLSTTLRISILATQASIATALASLQFEAVPPLERTLNHLYQSQKLLDKTQKIIIHTTESYIYLNQVKITSEINKLSYDKDQLWQFLITSVSFFKPLQIPQFAVQPDSIGGIGPNYEWKNNAEALTTVSYSWSNFFQTNSKYQNSLNWINTISMQCGVKANLKGTQWEIKTIVDKY